MPARFVAALALAFLSLLATGASQEPIKMVLIGDSTVCDYPAESPTRGWGQFIGEYFRDSVKVVNLAASGRSTKTFINEGRWTKALAEKPQWVWIQFGHNDSHARDHPEATDAATDYRDYLRRYVNEARGIGAKPIFITPMCRRNFTPDGKLNDNLAPYAEAMKAVGAELHVPVIDLHELSGALYLKIGPEACLELANKPGDGTHFGERGARTMAELVMSKLPEAAPELRPLLKTATAK